MASPSDDNLPWFLSFMSPPPSSDNGLLPLPQPQPLSSPLPTAPLSARGNVPKKKSMKKRRKPRTTKRSNTTFIAADVANFRQMVQQVTGVRFDNTSVAFASPLSRPEALRAGDGGQSYDAFGTFPGSGLVGESTGLGGLAAMFDMPKLAEKRAAGVYGELLGVDWAAASPFHT